MPVLASASYGGTVTGLTKVAEDPNEAECSNGIVIVRIINTYKIIVSLTK